MGDVTYQAFAPTEGALRGISSKIEFIDEFFFMRDKEKLDKLFFIRYPESAVGMIAITTPNGGNSWTDDFHESTEVFEVLYSARLCAECATLASDNADGYIEIEKRCHALGHVEPLDLPWKSKAMEKSWSQYITPRVTAQEFGGQLRVSDVQLQFDRALRVSSMFSQFSYEQRFSRFDIGIDPCDYGTSELGACLVGYAGVRYHILAADAALVNDATTIEDTIVEWILYYIARLRTLHLLVDGQQRVYIWIESPGHHGARVQARLRMSNLSNIARVMKYNRYNRALEEYEDYNVSKTVEKTEYYVQATRELILTNRLKISRHMFTHSRNGPKRAREKLKVQFNNYARLESGKLSGKDKGNDDMLIATIMAIGCSRQSMDVRRPALRSQLVW